MKKTSKPNPQLGAEILKVVDNQLRDLDPPETKETYDRLIASGISDIESKRLIAVVLLDEMSQVMRSMEKYNPERYIASLRKLPKLPWE